MPKKYIKKKVGSQLGYRTPDHYKGKALKKVKKVPKFNPSRFKIQHKG